MEGWIKLHRKLLENPITTKDSDYLAIWIYLLLSATHKEYDALFKGEKITLKKGQLITGALSIAKKLKINKDKVQRVLKSFENDKQITQQTSNQNRLISILNWEQYQELEKQNDKPVINECETTDKRVITNNNVKNIKNDKNVTTIDSCIDGLQVDDSCIDGLQDVIDFYQNNIGLLSPYGLETLQDYAKDMPGDLIILAMKKAVEADKRTMQYIKGILNNWHKTGIKTVLDAKKEDEQFRKNNEKQEPKKNYQNHEQRDVSGIDFTKFYANGGKK